MRASFWIFDSEGILVEMFVPHAWIVLHADAVFGINAQVLL